MVIAHQIPQGPTYANVIDERSRTDSRQTLVAGNHMGTCDFVMSREPEDCKGLLVYVSSL